MELSVEEENLIKMMRISSGQYGVRYSQRFLKFTDGVATTEVWSEDEQMIDAFAKCVNWDNNNLIDYYRKRDADIIAKKRQ
jgi:hypothetical protein